jgi:hypothetical protein
VYFSYGFAAASGPDNIKVQINTPPNTYLELQAWEFAGIKPGGFVAAEQANGSSQATNGTTTPAIAVAGSGSDLLFAWGVFIDAGTIGNGFTLASNDVGDPAEYLLVTLPSTPVTATMTAGGDWTIVGATFETN